MTDRRAPRGSRRRALEWRRASADATVPRHDSLHHAAEAVVVARDTELVDRTPLRNGDDRREHRWRLGAAEQRADLGLPEEAEHRGRSLQPLALEGLSDAASRHR